MASKKPIFQQFVEANEAMIACYEAVDHTQYTGANISKASGVCVKEKSKVMDILNSNQMTMTQLIKDRAQIVRNLEKQMHDRPVIADESIRVLM